MKEKTPLFSPFENIWGSGLSQWLLMLEIFEEKNTAMETFGNSVTFGLELMLRKECWTESKGADADSVGYI